MILLLITGLLAALNLVLKIINCKFFLKEQPFIVFMQSAMKTKGNLNHVCKLYII